MPCDKRPVYTSPRTEAHMRAVLAAIRHNEECFEESIEDLEAIAFATGAASGAITSKQVVYVPSTGTFAPAQATSATLSNAVGIAVADIADTETGLIQVTGVVTIASWGLTAGTIYYLSAVTPGLLTATAPTTIGQYVVQIGKALSGDTLALTIQQSILL